MTPRALDLFCGAGGASVGLARAGFTVTGVDHLAHPDYPFELHLADAMDVVRDWAYLSTFDLVAASPPCPFWSTITPDPSAHEDLLTPVLTELRAWGGLYCVENVEGARKVMNHPVKCCGSSFGLRVRRHRYFEIPPGPLIMGSPCRHKQQGRPIGVYGDHPQDDREYRRPDGTLRGERAKSVAEAQHALGIDWMTTWSDLKDSIPPAFTEHIGSQLIDYLRTETP